MKPLAAAALLASTIPIAAAQAAPAACTPDGGPAPDPAAAATTIRQAETDWAAAMSTNEAPVLARILADDAVVALDGRLRTKAAMVAQAQRRPPGTFSDTLDAMDVRVFGAVAIAAGSERFATLATGHRDRIVWSDTWVRCGGQWRLVGSISVTAPPR